MKVINNEFVTIPYSSNKPSCIHDTTQFKRPRGFPNRGSPHWQSHTVPVAVLSSVHLSPQVDRVSLKHHNTTPLRYALLTYKRTIWNRQVDSRGTSPDISDWRLFWQEHSSCCRFRGFCVFIGNKEEGKEYSNENAVIKVWGTTKCLLLWLKEFSVGFSNFNNSINSLIHLRFHSQKRKKNYFKTSQNT